MKTTKIFLLLAALAFSVGAWGQNFKLSPNIQKSFDSAYPDVSNVKWIKGDYAEIKGKQMSYQAIFKSEGYIITLVTDSLGSDYYESDIDLYIPNKVKKKFHLLCPNVNEENIETDKINFEALPTKNEKDFDFIFTYQYNYKSIPYQGNIIMDSLGNVLYTWKELPISQIPQKISIYIKQNFNQKDYKKIEYGVMEKSGQKSYAVVLKQKDNYLEEERIYFDSKYNFVKKEHDKRELEN